VPPKKSSLSCGAADETNGEPQPQVTKTGARHVLGLIHDIAAKIVAANESTVASTFSIGSDGSTETPPVDSAPLTRRECVPTGLGE
jgi:hypothetical protein